MSETGIHIGDATHIQDQSILFVSFNTRKIINNNPDKPIPPLDFEFILLYS